MKCGMPVLILISVVLLAGCCCLPQKNCAQGTTPDGKGNCCADTNGNRICDNQETTTKQTRATTTAPTTKVTTTKAGTSKATTLVSTTTLAVPKDKKSCESAGGLWEPIGPSPVAYCNMPTGDGGKECSSQSDCKGACIAKLTSIQVENVTSGGIVEATGTCTSYRITNGCLPFVEDGKVKSIMCFD
jgi:hypothetical protein